MTLKRSLLSLVLFVGAACAQPLAALAPADTALSLSFSYRGGILNTLDDDFADMPWETGKMAAAKLLRALAARGDDAELNNLWTMYADMLELDGHYDSQSMMTLPGMEEFLELCPTYEDAFDMSRDYRERYPEGVPSEGLLTLSLSPFSPIPVLTGLLRVDPGASALYQNLQDTLLGCLEEGGMMDVTRLEQDGVPFYVVGDASDVLAALGSLDNLFFFATNPEALRSVIRQAQGGDESSLAASPLYQRTAERFGDAGNSLGLSLDFETLALALENLGESVGGMAGDPSEAYLLERGVRTLRTLGGFGAQLSASDDGLLSEALLLPNPEGGDAALLTLLRCETCRVSSPRLAPEGTVALSTQYLPYRELWAYTQDWLDGLAAAGGERLDLQSVLEDELGFDLDRALFDWLGSEVHSFTLEAISPDLRTLIYNPAQVLVVPVSSPEAARAGFAEWAEVLDPLWRMALQDGGLAQDEGMEDLLSESIDVRETSYQETPLTRVRFGPNLDLAYGFLGNYLVVGMPASAVESVIDTYQGGRGFMDSAAYRSLQGEAPESLSSLYYSDDRSMVQGLADLLALTVQPLAFVSEIALQEWLEDASADDEAVVAESDPYAYAAYLEGVTPTPLEAPGETSGELADPEPASNFYELLGLTPGQEVTVRLESDDFDSYLYLIDAGQSLYLDENDDDETSSNSELSFTAEEGVQYWLEVSSYSGELGTYTLLVSAAQGAPMTATPLAVPGEATGDLAEASVFYDLGDLEPGSALEVRLSSPDFDTYLTLLDADSREVLDENDDGETGTDSSLTFSAEPGGRYLLGVSSYGGGAGGAYTLSVNPAGASPEMPSAEDLPSFGELLDLFGLLPQTLEVLADHLSSTTGYTEQGENGIYSRSVTRIRW